MRRFAVAFAVLGLSAALATPALAFNPLSYCGSDPTAWPSGSVETVFQMSSVYTTSDLGAGAVDSIMNDAMNEWGVPGCSGFDAQQGADTAGDPLDNSNNNDIVGFYNSGWPSSFGSTTLAVTLPAWTGNCDLVSADMVINGVNYQWIDGSPQYWDEADLQAIAAHEFGHWIGLDHSNYSGSSLQAFYSGGTGERTLTCDDTEASCTLYPSSGNSCTNDRYCECGVGCNDGLCGGVPGDDDDSVGDDDDDDSFNPGDCSGPSETWDESEPNDWQGEDDVDYIEGGGGDLTYRGTLTCGNNGEAYTADADWVVIDFPCSDDARFTLDWDNNADLDFYNWDSNGNQLAFHDGAEYSGPVSDEQFGGGRMFFLVACWDGATSDYELTVDWAPFGDIGDDDDSVGDDDDTVGDDDDTGDDDDVGDDDDDDTNIEDDDDTTTLGDDDDGGGSGRRSLACGCDVSPVDAAPSAALLFGLLGLTGAVARRRQD